MWQHRGWGLLVIAAMIGALACVFAPPVSAHAAFKSSVPAPNATVTTVPTQVVITFSEETSATKSGGSVTDASGATVSTGFKVNLDDRTMMAIALKPSLPNGVYTVKWNTLTEDDNGMADGTFTFTLQAAQAAGTGTAATGTATTGTAPASGSAVAGTAPASATTAPAATATTAPTVAPTTTTAPTATRAATAAVATGTGGGTAATSAPTTLPQTGGSESGSRAPWVFTLLIVAALAIAGGLAFRLRTARR
jgi:copper resistance protein C